MHPAMHEPGDSGGRSNLGMFVAGAVPETLLLVFIPFEWPFVVLPVDEFTDELLEGLEFVLSPSEMPLEEISNEGIIKW